MAVVESVLIAVLRDLFDRAEIDWDQSGIAKLLAAREGEIDQQPVRHPLRDVELQLVRHVVAEARVANGDARIIRERHQRSFPCDGRGAEAAGNQTCVRIRNRRIQTLSELQATCRIDLIQIVAAASEVIAFVRRIRDVEHPRPDLMLNRRIPLLRHRRRAVRFGDGNALAEQRARTGRWLRAIRSQAAADPG